MRKTERSRAFVRKSFCILPGPERGGGREGIVPWHQVASDECLAEFINSFVYGSSRFTNVHEKVFADRFYPVEAGLSRDLPEFFFRGGERDPWGPGEFANCSPGTSPQTRTTTRKRKRTLTQYKVLMPFARSVCIDAGFKGNDPFRTNAREIIKSHGVCRFQNL